MKHENLYTAAEMQKILDIPKGTYWAFRTAGMIPVGGRKVGGFLLFDDSDVAKIKKALEESGYQRGKPGRPKLGEERKYKTPYRRKQ